MNTKPLKRILMVEDEPDIQAVARIALEMVGGFEVQTCISGPEAIKIAPQFKPDLILLDMMMPGMDGITTLKHLRELPELTKTPVMFMTAKVQKHEVEGYLELGAIAVIAKPFNPMSLAGDIKDLWSLHVPQ